MYSIILAFRVLEAKIGHPGPIASPAAEDGSGWRRCGTGWRRLRGVRRLRKSGFRTTVREPDGHVEVSASGQEAGGGISVCRGAPELLTRADGIASAAKIPPSRRAGTHRAAGGFDTDLPRRAGAIRGFSSGRRAYRRQKSVPGRAPRRKRRPNPDTIRTGSVTAPRFRSRGPSFALLHSANYPTRSRQPASEVYAPRRGIPLCLHCPGKPPTFHPAREASAAAILTSTKQRTSRTTQQQNNKTAQLGNRRP